MPAYLLRTDGGARGNPGPAGAAFVLEAPDGAVECAAGRYLGETTSNVAEYEALVWGLENALDRGVSEISVYADSELVVRQLTGAYKVKHPNIRPLHGRAIQLLARFERWRVEHVPREANAAADALVNEAIDTRAQVGEACAKTSDPEQGRLFE